MKANLETWQQDPFDPDFWIGADGLIINTAAPDERSDFSEIVRVLAQVEVVTKPVNAKLTAAF
jgi:hypothetical protein